MESDRARLSESRRALYFGVAAACGLGSFVVYLATLSPTVAGGDSGELIAVAYTLGVAHPPGFPLFALLGKLFTLLPFGAIAWRVNLMSAVCDSAAAFLLCRAASRWTGSIWSGVIAAGAFAFSPVVWPYAVTAEVFALNNLFVAGLIDLSVSATLQPLQRRWIVPLSMFWLGLGFSNHHTLVFFGLPFVLYQLSLERRKLTDPRFLAVQASAFAIGMLPYLYMPLAASARPPIAWGDPSSWSGFVTQFLRREYGTFQLASETMGDSQPQLMRRLLTFGERWASSTFWLGPVLVLGALVTVFRRSFGRALTGLWVGALTIYLVVFSALANVHLDIPLHVTVQERFWQQAIVVASALMGVGLFELGRTFPGKIGRVLSPALAVALPAALLLANFPTMDHSHRLVIRNHCDAILRSLPRNAVLFTSSDETSNGVRFLQVVEGVRRDVRVIPTGLATKPWFRLFAAKHLLGVTLPTRGEDRSDPSSFTALAFMDANIRHFPIFIVNREPWLQTLEERYHVWPVGVADQVLPGGTEPELEPWVRGAQASFAGFDVTAASRYPVGTWEHYVAQNYWKQYQRFGMAVARGASDRGDDPAVDRLVIEVLETLAQRHPSPDPLVFKNLGVAYQYLSRTDSTAVEPMVRHWRRYLSSNPTQDSDRETIRALVERAEKRAQ
jgi:hypothetical protein